MGVPKKNKRKIIVDEKIYYWFTANDRWNEPLAHIISDDRTFIASCNLYCPVLKIIKDNKYGQRTIPVPDGMEEIAFTPKFISNLIHLGNLSK